MNSKIKLLLALCFLINAVCFAGTMTDPRDGKTYKTVKIGNQVWMAENLNYSVNPGKQSWCYENKNSYCNKYGRLYTWFAAIGMPEQQCGYGKDCNLRGQVQGVCPSGWHLPSEKEFESLIIAAGGEKVAGKKLKSNNSWSSNFNGDDSYGFNALPAGYRNGSGNFSIEGRNTFFWSSSEFDSFRAYYMSLLNNQETALLDVHNFTFNFSVRCIKNYDEQEFKEFPAETFSSSSNALSSSSILKSSIKKESEPLLMPAAGPCYVSASSVVENTLFDPRDGKKYKTVKIGNQVWMAENLKYSVNPGKQSWCLEDKEENCDEYGRYYTWAAAMNESENTCGMGKECNILGLVQGICPEGWHLPKREDFMILAKTVGGTNNEMSWRWDGAGTKLKAKESWSNNGNGDDAFGFSALAVGDRYNDGLFYYKSISANFWTCTESDEDKAEYMLLYNSYDDASLRKGAKDGGRSIRCLKDE